MMDESAYESAEGGSGFREKKIQGAVSAQKHRHFWAAFEKLFEVVFWQPNMLICMETLSGWWQLKYFRFSPRSLGK